MAARKLQTEIDRTFKKVSEGVELFEGLYDKLQTSSNQGQKEKLESDLKTQIKKLQRLRDQIKVWLQSNEIKDKKPLLDNRRLIETQMERFKAAEKEMKTKAFSKEGLIAASRLGPEEKAKVEMSQWLTSMVDELSRQIEVAEAEIEQALASSKKSKKASVKDEHVSSIEHRNERRSWHISRLEILLRMLENGSLEVDQINDVKEDIAYFVESNNEDDFEEDEGIYDEFNLDDEEETFGLKEADESTVQDSSMPTDEPAEAPPAPAPPPEEPPKAPKKEEKKSAKKAPVTTEPTEPKPAPEPAPASASVASPAPAPAPAPASPAPKAAAPPPIRYATAAAAAVAASSAQGSDEQASRPPRPPSDGDARLPDTLSDLVVSFEWAKQKSALRDSNLPHAQHALATSYTNGVPEPQDSERPKHYVPKDPYPTPPYYPQTPASIFDNPALYTKFDVDTLFYIFYYQPGTYHQYLAARELKKQSWRFHKQYLTWFQRHSEPQTITDEYEQGAYVYFDWEGSWCPRPKNDFRFEYRWLEDN